ncbi:MAG: helix-turn-helix domain-containing protein [Phycisphaerae bacterium]|nr:helix-turn-helix domain-containing protein [Phycisphaerae bacterium]
MDINQVLIQNAYDIIEKISQELQMSIGLGILHPEQAEVEVVARCEGKGVAIRLELNSCHPLQVTAPGKAILAFLSEDQQKNVIDRIKFTKYTKNSIIDKDVLNDELIKINRDGFAVDHGEENDGAYCVAVPVFGDNGQVLAGLWCTHFSNRLKDDIFANAYQILKRGADFIQQRIAISKCNNVFAAHIIQACKEYMDEHFRNQIDIKGLAEKHNVKYAWFRDHFKKIVGVAPKQYVLQKQMDEALALLKNSQLSVKEIAEVLGYSNQNYFSAAFYKRFGYYPTEIRKK